MADNTDNIAGFVQRWSRRKLATDPDAAPTPEQQPSPPAAASHDGSVPEDLEHFDFDALEFSSDFTRFMRNDVPAHLRTKGLNALWTSHDTISRPDELDDYLEDFSEEAMALPPELARSAYEIGCGFLNDGQRTSEENELGMGEHSTDAASSTSDRASPAPPQDESSKSKSSDPDLDAEPSSRS